MIEPMPPMMTMKSNWKERSMENAAGSQDPKWMKPHKAPATPTMKELTAKADSLAYMGRMPMTAAATSMSRMAIHSRPMAPRTRFLANNAMTTKTPRQNQYLLKALSMGMPRTCNPLTETDPESESLSNHLIRKNIQSLKAELAKVRTGRASTALIDPVKVDYYGSAVPISQVANVTVQDARTLGVQAWEKKMVGVIDKAIRESFGVADPIIVLIRSSHPDGIYNPETLKRVRDLTADFAQLPGINASNITSLATEVGFRVRPGTLREVLDQAVAQCPGLGPVLARCSTLVNEVAARDEAADVPPGSRVDVLPPFAGG